MPHNLFKELKSFAAEFDKNPDYDKSELVRTNIDLHPEIIRRLKIIAACNDTDSKNLSQGILTATALKHIPEL